MEDKKTVTIVEPAKNSMDRDSSIVVEPTNLSKARDSTFFDTVPNYDFKQAKTYYPDNEKFTIKSKYNDIWALVLYVITFLAFVVFSVFMFIDFKFIIIDEDDIKTLTDKNIYISAVISGIISIGLGIVYFISLKFMAKYVIHFSIISTILFVLGITIYSFIGNQVGLSIVSFIITLLMVYLYYRLINKIKFSSIVMKNVTDFSISYYGNLLVALVFLILQISFMLYWGITLLASVSKYHSDTYCQIMVDENGQELEICSFKASLYFIYIFMLFCLFWTSQIMKNIVHTTICGSFSSFYFSSNSKKQDYCTITALSRSVTTSLGSICFGSLVSSFVSTIQSLIPVRSDDCVFACCSLLFGYLDKLLKYFNNYAYTYCAIYGTSYIESGKSTLNLLKTKGVDLIINDTIIEYVLLIGSIFISLISTGVAWLYLRNINEGDYNYLAMALVCCFVVSMLLISIITQVIQSSSSSFFVCLAEDSQALYELNPLLSEEIRKKYPQIMSKV